MSQTPIKQYFTFRNVYLFLLLVIAVSLPLSKYLSSMFQILLAITWLVEGKYDEKWRRIKIRPQILIFTLLFFIPLLGMLYTKDMHFGFGDLRVKLPLLLFPVILGSIKPLNDKEMRIVLGGFVVAVMVGALVSLSIMLGINPLSYTNDRETVVFISHIRFALMLVLAVFILYYYAFRPETSLRNAIIFIGCALGLTIFLFLLKSLTGVVVLVIGSFILALRWSKKQTNQLIRWSAIVGLVTVPLLACMYLTGQITRFYTIHDDVQNPDKVTVNGNPYWHDLNNKMIENGYHVGLYQCESELREAWNKISKMDYDGFDKRGHQLKYTLGRYMTSLGLRKDAYGASLLKPEDIALVENGFANCRYRNPGRFSVRIYETIWEIDQYRKGANPSGHSITQRFEYAKTGWAIFRDHPLFGVGTGDTKTAFQEKYDEMQSRLEVKWRLRAHNQFLTFLITYGLFGFIILVMAIILPVVIEKRKNKYFMLMFLLIILLSMLNEDTLETQAGVAFFALFYCLFVFADGQGGSQSHEKNLFCHPCESRDSSPNNELNG